MTFEIAKKYLDENPNLYPIGFPLPQLSIEAGNLCFNNHVALPIIISSRYDKNQNPVIKNESGIVLGTIFFSNHNIIIQKEDMTEQCFAAYLVDVTDDDFRSGIDYVLKSDYLVLDKKYFVEYKTKYYSTSGLWGDFIHKDTPDFPKPLLALPISEITAIQNLELPTHWHQENIIRAIQQPHAFERFLKNYHLLELLFDWQTMKEIKEHYDNHHFNQAAEVLRRYERTDLERIMYVIKVRHKNIHSIANALNHIKPFRSIAEDIFYNYGKESNPMSLKLFEDILNKPTLFAEDSFKNEKGKVTAQPDYPTFILRLACYWIYRLRSSVAHAKIGEYQLSSKDEKLVLEFAEPLLKEILLQCFKH